MQVVEKDCSFLVAEQTPAPPTNPSNPPAESAGTSTAAEGGTSTTVTVTSPPAPNKLTKVLENRERKQLDGKLFAFSLCIQRRAQPPQQIYS
jgi:hypothetical protein